MFHIYTDTSANLPTETIKKYGLKMVHFTYTLDNGQTCIGTEGDFNGKDFYNAMRDGVNVKTSMVNIIDYMDAFRVSLEEGYDVLYIGMSGGISGAAHAASIAATELQDEFPDRKVLTIDTYAASLGEGLLVIHAAEMAQNGVEAERIFEIIEKEKKTMCQYFTVDDLEYLKRGGRLSGIASFVGTLLQIKPILTGDDEGRIVLCGKSRGRKAALNVLAEKYDKLAKDKSSTIGIAHADADDDAQILLKALREKHFTGECINVCYEPVTGAHVGPGTVALFFNGTEK